MLPLVLVAGTTGTLLAMNKVPFVSSSGTGNQALIGASNGAGGITSITSPHSAAAAHSGTADPTRSAKASPTQGAAQHSSPGTGSTSGNSSSTTTGGDATGSSSKTSAAATHASTGSAGGGGSASDPTVVSTTYSEIKNVATSVCVSGNAGAGVQSCDGSSTVGFHEVPVSGGFELVSQGSGLCLTNLTTQNDIAYAFSCDTMYGSEIVWKIGTRTSQGGTLTNSGLCLSYSATAAGNLNTATCNASSRDQLWYDGGPT